MGTGTNLIPFGVSLIVDTTRFYLNAKFFFNDTFELDEEVVDGLHTNI